MIYFDNGATTFPKPASVINAVGSVLRNSGANPGRSGHKMSVKASEMIYDCRKTAAEFFDFDKPENVIFTLNCTMALNTVIQGTLKKGDHAVISSLEHNAVLRPLEALRSKGVGYSIAEVVEGDDDATLNNFRQALQSNTKLVVCTHASNVFGIKLPIERIAALCGIYGILFCVDAAQTAGTVPISLKDSGIDYLCAAGHKGLYGPMGTGILIINSEHSPNSLIQGGTGSFSSDRAQPEMLPDKFESGTPNLAGIAGLNEGMRFVSRKGISKLSAYEMRLARLLYDGLSEIPPVVLYTQRPDDAAHVPVISFNIGETDSEKVAALLNDKFNIAVRAGLHCAPLAHESAGTIEQGTVRAVMSTFNTPSQVGYFINSINKIVRIIKK